MKITHKVINFNKVSQTGGSGFVSFDPDAIKAKATKKSEDSLKAYELWKQQQNPGMSGSASVSQPQAVNVARIRELQRMDAQRKMASVSQPQAGFASVSQPKAVNVARIRELQRMDAQRKMASVSQPQAGVASVSKPTPSQTTPGVASVSKPNPTLVASTSQTQSRKINSRGKKRLDQYLDPNYKKQYPYFNNGDIFYEVYEEVGKRGKVRTLNEKKYSGKDPKFFNYDVVYDDGTFKTMQSEIFMLHDWETKLE